MSLYLEMLEGKTRKHELFDRVFDLAKSGLCEFPSWEDSIEELEAKLEIADTNTESKKLDYFTGNIHELLTFLAGGEHILIPYDKALELTEMLLEKGHGPIRTRKDLFKHVCSSYYGCPQCNLYSEK